MSALYGSMTTDASRGGGCTRRGHKAMSCHLRGWDEGIRVEMRLDHNGKVEWAVYRTSGSNGARPSKVIARGVEGQAELTGSQTRISATNDSAHEPTGGA